jgi:trehalose synthase
MSACLDDYITLLGAPAINELRSLAPALVERDVLMVNSTAVAGGVAEILNRLVPLARELDVIVTQNLKTYLLLILALPRTM